jgi:hypothetical protein
MAWYSNNYHCSDCGANWSDEWSCCCDDECPNCGSRNWSPFKSEDLTTIVMRHHDGYVVMQSSEQADDRPMYREVARYSALER